jgi:hypothetical protein
MPFVVLSFRGLSKVRSFMLLPRDDSQKREANKRKIQSRVCEKLANGQILIENYDHLGIRISHATILAQSYGN